jgi:hypothetical protein
VIYFTLKKDSTDEKIRKALLQGKRPCHNNEKFGEINVARVMLLT